MESSIIFDEVSPTESEEMYLTVERLADFLWLHFIDERLPAYISKTYAKDLQRSSFKDLQPQISMNMDSVLLEWSTQEDIKVAYS